MQTYKYQVRFMTPAFMGDAEQNGRWRTPPFKALLRQWWRVAYAADHGFDVPLADMRRDEAKLFGHAWLEDDTEAGRPIAARKSRVRLRLDCWEEGSLKKANWASLGTVSHPEVRQAVASDLYLGYGPVVLPRGAQQPTLKANAAIQAGESATFALAVPDEEASRIEHALGLMDRYGSVGGRSRNGWGSFVLRPLSRAEGAVVAVAPQLRPWQDALNLDWPHALGYDDKGALIWQTEGCADWKAVMKRLAEIKIGLRTQFRFTSGKNASDPEARHWLSYPVTNHSVKDWGNYRLPNTLRFKVRSSADGKLFGVIFHVPHKPPAGFQPNMQVIEDVWRRVHQFLDAPAQKLTRIPE